VSRQFVGLLSVTDFIDILRHYHRRGIAMDDLSARTIGEVMADGEGRRLQHSEFLGMPADTHVFASIETLLQHNHRFLPIMPPNEARVLSVMSYYDVLNFLVAEFREQRKLFEDSIFDLGIGTYGEQCLTVPTTARLVDVLDILESADISAIPVVDATGRVVDLYSRSDITFLATATDAASVINNLGLSIREVLEARQAEIDIKDRLHTCSVRASLQSVFELFSEIGFRRLVAVDETTGRCMGVVTARDLIIYFCKQ
jgi:5'-AMP-activated protein kinase, regulatory gamma subunit